MPLAKYHDMVKAFPSDRPNQPLTIAILPWRPRRDRPIPNAHRTKAPDKDLAINAVPIADEIAWPLFPAISLHQLATYPFRAGMRGRRKTQDFAAPMLQNQQPIQELKRDCWDHKQVQRGNPVGVVAQKCLPTLRRRSPIPRHILGQVVWPIVMPSLSSSPWILGAPQSGLARLTLRINFLTSADSFGRPPGDFDFHRQYKRKPARCHRITVSGLTIVKAPSTLGAKPYSPAITSRSMLPKVGRLADFRRRILS
jgi:hypothetical protein